MDGLTDVADDGDNGKVKKRIITRSVSNMKRITVFILAVAAIITVIKIRLTISTSDAEKHKTIKVVQKNSSNTITNHRDDDNCINSNTNDCKH